MPAKITRMIRFAVCDMTDIKNCCVLKRQLKKRNERGRETRRTLHTYHKAIGKDRTKRNEQPTEATADICYLDLFGHSRRFSGACSVLIGGDEGREVDRPVHL